MKRQPSTALAMLPTLALHGLALVMVSAILWGLVVLWPIPHLGYLMEARTGVIQAVEAGSPAALAGLRVGDQVVALYRQPWAALVWQWNVLPLIGPLDVPIPVTIQRAGMMYEVGVRVAPPAPPYQAVKVSYAVLALCCWLTGYLLGTVRRQEVPRARALAIFWLLASGIVGVYMFAINAAQPLRLLLHATLATVLMPAFVALHVWYPVQAVSMAIARRTRRWWLATSSLLVVLLLVIALVDRTLLFVVDLQGTPLALLAGCSGSGVLLWWRYHHTVIPHTRRQIRIIGVACMLVFLSWLFAFFGPTVVTAFTFVADPLLILAPALIPLAYLVGGVVPDLYRIDRLARRWLAHLVTLTTVSSLVLTVWTLLGVEPAVGWLWAGVGVLILYRPLHEVSLRLIAADVVVATAYRPLDAAIATLATSLERDTLVGACIAGVQATFGRPGVAVYYRTEATPEGLALIQQQHVPHAPPCLPDGVLLATCQRVRRVCTTATLYQALSSPALTETEADILAQPGMALWCPLVQADGGLVGLFVLGSRGDLEPYRASDLQQVQRLIDAAGLALANSQAYIAQCQAQERIRSLFRHIQGLQDRTASAIVREIHDEIINTNVRLNMEALERIVATLEAGPLRDELELAVESEAMTIHALRLICDQINPTGMNDPYGFGGVLRRQVDRANGLWAGTCRLVVQHPPQPIAPMIQREALRVTREAITNAMKHAQATEIVVTLQYPADPTAPLILLISDNGPGGPPFPFHPDHIGLPNLIESARFAGGTLKIRAEPGGGTTVIFTCPLVSTVAASSEGAYDGLFSP
jgi:signal transduction histidine kinase